MNLAILGLPLLLLLFIAGMPVAYSLLISSLYIMATSTGIQWVSISQQMVNGLNTFTILCVPMFLLAGKIMNACGITKRLFKFARALVGWLPGGLGHVNVLASFIFAGMSGTAIADASGLGLIEINAMEDAGYDKDFSCAVTAASSTLGPIIPPSMPLVVYGTVSSASIGALFIAGVLPGVLMALLMMVLVSLFALKYRYPRDKISNFRELLSALKEGFLPILTPVIILLGIYTGIFTPTESAAIVVVYSAFLGVVVYRELNLKKLAQVFRESATDVAGLCILVACATLFGTVLVKAKIPQMLISFVSSTIDSKIIFLLVMNLILLVVGMFMETVSAITILVPIILPVALSFGISPVHLGVIIVLNLMIGVISPPFGVVLFAVNKVGNIPLGRLVKALAPWYVVLLVALFLVTYIPWLTTWLPSLMQLGV